MKRAGPPLDPPSPGSRTKSGHYGKVGVSPAGLRELASRVDQTKTLKDLWYDVWARQTIPEGALLVVRTVVRSAPHQ